ncbi:hypothetical protein NUACC21_22100 [Scytonema sp. NUACC21]
MGTLKNLAMFKYVVGGTGAVLAVAAMTFMSSVDSVSAATRGTCGQKFDNVTVVGGQASWSLSCSGNKITITGWVKDTKADGKCANVKAEGGGQYKNPLATACPKGKVTHFTWTVPGREIKAYLYVA